MGFSEMNYQSFNISHELPLPFSKSFTKSMVHIYSTVCTLQHHSVSFPYLQPLSPTIRGYQELSCTFSHIQLHSVSFSNHHVLSDTIRGYQELSCAFRHIQLHSVSFSCLQLLSATIRCYQELSYTSWPIQHPSVSFICLHFFHQQSGATRSIHVLPATFIIIL